MKLNITNYKMDRLTTLVNLTELTLSNHLVYVSPLTTLTRLKWPNMDASIVEYRKGYKLLLVMAQPWTLQEQCPIARLPQDLIRLLKPMLI